jgi:nicotinamidase-related amidase
MDSRTKRNPDLHGSAPDSSRVALLLIDVINPFEFESADKLLPRAKKAAQNMAKLKARAKESGVPVIYANDNFGKWRSDFRAIYRRCAAAGSKGASIAKLLRPENDDYFILKPKHSAFFETTLETLLRYLGCDSLILTGFAGHICVLFTAMDAYMRDYHLWVPKDCIASCPDWENEIALHQIANTLKADISPTSQPKLNWNFERATVDRHGLKA